MERDLREEHCWNREKKEEVAGVVSNWIVSEVRFLANLLISLANSTADPEGMT